MENEKNNDIIPGGEFQYQGNEKDYLKKLVKKKEYEFKIIHPYKEDINSQEDFLDVEVKFKDKKYFGSVSTTNFINKKLKEYKETGENKNGSYFCAKGLIVLKDLTKETIKKTLDDLIERGDLQEFFEF